jgi:serine/threonine protein kinase
MSNSTTHPYQVGAEFVLVLSDLFDRSSTCHVRVKILRVYDFTKSQGMKVAILNTSHGYKSSQLPSEAFLKLYDRRFVDTRSHSYSYPWDPVKEKNATKVHDSIQPDVVTTEDVVTAAGLPVPGAKTYYGGLDCEERLGAHFTFDENDYEEKLKSFPDEKSVKEWIVEMKHHHETLSSFHTECRAYRQLRPIQGICIPKFYGMTLFDATSELPHNVDINVPGILIEFIDGVSLNDIDLNAPISTRNPHLAEAAFVCLDELMKHGVSHNDVRLANIICNEAGRVWLIDFAICNFHRPEIDDSDWNSHRESKNEEYGKNEDYNEFK